MTDPLDTDAKRNARLARLAVALAEAIVTAHLPPAEQDAARARLADAPLSDREVRQALRRVEPRNTAPTAASATAPTRELVRHRGAEPVVETVDESGQPLAAPRHRFRWYVDQIAPALTAEAYQAALRLSEARVRRENRPAVIDINGAGGSTPGSRLPATDAQIRAATEFRAIWTEMSRDERYIIETFVFELGGDPVEWGRAYSGLRGADAARGGSRVAVKLALAVLARRYEVYDRQRYQRTGTRDAALSATIEATLVEYKRKIGAA